MSNMVQHQQVRILTFGNLVTDRVFLKKSVGMKRVWSQGGSENGVAYDDSFRGQIFFQGSTTVM